MSTTTNADAYRAARDASGRTGYYSGWELDELAVAQIDDEIVDLQARIKELRAEKRSLRRRLADR